MDLIDNPREVIERLREGEVSRDFLETAAEMLEELSADAERWRAFVRLAQPEEHDGLLLACERRTRPTIGRLFDADAGGVRYTLRSCYRRFTGRDDLIGAGPTADAAIDDALARMER